MNRILKSFTIGLLLSMAAVGQVDERAKGIDLYQAGNYLEAITVLTAVVEDDPTDKVAWTYLGGSLMNTGKKKEAIEAFKKPAGGPAYDPKYEKEFRVINRPRSEYTPEARADRVSGTVLTMVEFKADGKVGFIVVVRGLSHGLSDSAVDSIKRTTFSPAVKDGKPVATIRMLSTSFNVY